jgi:hypothetical protein
MDGAKSFKPLDFWTLVDPFGRHRTMGQKSFLQGNLSD